MMVSVLMVWAQDAVPSGSFTTNDVWRLGAPVVAMLLAFYLSYRFGVLPERTRADRAEAEKTEALRLTLPAVERMAMLGDRMLEVVETVEREVGGSSTRSRRAAP
jgi:hypothetical protein